jgi:hypothetical protein
MRDTDPWVSCAQTPDINHIIVLHDFEMLGPNIADTVEWNNHSMFFELNAMAHGQHKEARTGIVGTSMFFETGKLNGRWFGLLVGHCIHQPGKTRTYVTFAVERTGDEQGDRNFLAFVRSHTIAIGAEDRAVVKTIHFRPGTLTKSDATLARFLDYVRNFPRAHPSAEFIN